jgi:hypothetical protein
MWQTPLSIVSPKKATPWASSAVRAVATSSTCSAIGCVLESARGVEIGDEHSHEVDAADMRL